MSTFQRAATLADHYFESARGPFGFLWRHAAAAYGAGIVGLLAGLVLSVPCAFEPASTSVLVSAGAGFALMASPRRIDGSVWPAYLGTTVGVALLGVSVDLVFHLF